MGQLTLPSSGNVYVDTNAVIYRVERIEPYLAASAPLWDALDAGSASVVTSELTLLEVLVKPLRDGNTALASLYRTVLLGTAGFTCVPITRTILEAAAQLRAAHQLKTPPRPFPSAAEVVTFHNVPTESGSSAQRHRSCAGCKRNIFSRAFTWASFCTPPCNRRRRRNTAGMPWRVSTCWRWADWFSPCWRRDW